MTTTTNEILRELWSKDDSPMYLFNENTLYENIVNMGKAFHRYYGNTYAAYSFKTNYLADICQIANEAGLLAEVVSPYERMYAMELGFTPDRIVYNGVIPNTAEKVKLASCGGFVNVDNYDELRDIYFMAKEQDITIPIGIRVTFDAGNDLKSRFGIDVDSDDFSGAMAFFQHNTHLEFRGFQCHIGSARQPKYWKNKIDRMIALAKTYGAKYIDLGGGMFGPMAPELAEQFNGYAYGGYEEYAQIIAGAMKKAFPDESVMLMIEPGTALVGNTMKMAATITNIKFVRGQIYLTANCASNHMGVIADMKKLVPEVVHMNDNACTFTDVIVGGDTCLEYDYLVNGISGEFSIGDRLVFDNVGAYSISSSRQFIVPRPKVVSEVTGEVLREAEGFTDMFARYLEKTSEHRMKNA